MNDSLQSDVTAVINPAAAHRLFTLGCAALAVAVMAAWWTSPLTDSLQLMLGITIIVLGCLPSLEWARRSRPWFPCFEISTLTGVVFYALPLISHYDDLAIYSDAVLETSGFLVVLYLGAAVLCFNLIKAPHTTPRWATQRLLPDSMLRYMPAGLILNTVYLYLDRFGNPLPPEIDGSVRALCFGLGIITAFVIACYWGQNRLSHGMKILFSLSLIIQVLLLFSQLYLIRGMSLLILCGIGYTTTRRNLPWLVLIVLLPIIAVLHSGKSEMRKLYWADAQPLPMVTRLPAFFSQWIELGLQKKPSEGSTNLAAKLAERASLFQMLCLSVDQIPSLRSHLNGESYVDIPAQIIPRFLWPDKPSSLLSNVRLAIYFGLVDPNNAYSTSIAFGVISEAYVNFGAWGVLALGAVTGVAFKYITLRSIGAPMFSAIGIFMILLTAWSFQAELVMATWLASLFQACAFSIGVPLAWKKVFNGS